MVEERNGYISLTWLETLPDSEKLVIDFLDNCATSNLSNFAAVKTRSLLDFSEKMKNGLDLNSIVL